VRAGIALALGGAVALATSAVSPWFSSVYCGWTCYSPLSDTTVGHIDPRPSTAFAGLGPAASIALVAVILAGLAAALLAVRVVTQPNLGYGRNLPNRLVHIEAAAYAGVAGAVAVVLGVAVLARASRLESPVA
jgi:heme/copper-type cytochrome/quinol oxidase subunit 1